MRKAIFAALVALLLAGCGSRPVVGGYSSVAPTTASADAEIAKLHADWTAAVAYYTHQDNSCHAPSGIWPAKDCVLTEPQFSALKQGIEVTTIGLINAAERAHTAWVANPNPATAAQMETAISKAQKSLDGLGILKP